MKNKHQNINNELKELGVPLEHKPDMPLSAPTGYFDTFKKDTLELIKAIDFVENLPKNMPQEVPNSYFEDFKSEMLEQVDVLEFEKAMSKEMPQNVPAGYFEQSKLDILAKIESENTETQTSPLTVTRSNKRKNWALAASMALILSAGLFFVNTDSAAIDIENELSNVSIEMIDEYIDQHEYDFDAYEMLENPQVTTQSMQTLEEEILQETENLSNEEIFEYVL